MPQNRPGGKHSIVNMYRQHKKEIIRIIIAALLFIASAAAVRLIGLSGAGAFLAYLIPYIYIGYDTLSKAAYGIAHGQIFDENFLMAIATVGAFATAEYPEAVFVMLFYRVGELFEHMAVGKSRASIAALMDIMPEYANLEGEDGITETDPENVPVGSIIVIKPGERVPLDGIVIEGSSALNTMALTGESMPVDVAPGDKVISGCVNINGVLRVRTVCEYTDSTVSRILELVEDSAANKAVAESFITRFARVYTPAVVACAALLSVVPPLFAGNWPEWIYRGLTFLVISCPCALVISIPLTFFGGIGKASRRGILVKGGNYLEALAMAEAVVLDKTGTLTEGKFKVCGLYPKGVSEEELLRLGAHGEYYSEHPIALSIKEAYKGEIIPNAISEYKEIPGKGIECLVNGRKVLAGSPRLVGITDADYEGTVVHIACDGVYVGCIALEDSIKEGAAEALETLKKLGVRETAMLTGDRREAAKRVAEDIGIDAVYSELMPGDKVKIVEEMLAHMPGEGKLVYVGDGINDAPVLSRSDVGIAMGAMGSDAAIEAADVVIMDDGLNKLPEAIAIARQTRKIVKQNIAMTLGVKGVILALGALGFAGMWAAVFADVGIMVIAVLNAMRMLAE